MTGTSIRRALAVLAASIALTPAQAQGPVGTLPKGPYVCEVPGDASGPAGIPQPDAAFSVESSSRYVTPQGVGTYLKRGKSLVMSSGPRQGESYTVGGTAFLHRIENGQAGRLRCVHGGN